MVYIFTRKFKRWLDYMCCVDFRMYWLSLFLTTLSVYILAGDYSYYTAWSWSRSHWFAGPHHKPNRQHYSAEYIQQRNRMHILWLLQIVWIAISFISCHPTDSLRDWYVCNSYCCMTTLALSSQSPLHSLLPTQSFFLLLWRRKKSAILFHGCRKKQTVWDSLGTRLP